jgi:hypothetical protein
MVEAVPALDALAALALIFGALAPIETSDPAKYSMIGLLVHDKVILTDLAGEALVHSPMLENSDR